MPDKIVTNGDLLVSNMLEIQAIIRILKSKGITTEDEKSKRSSEVESGN